MVALKGREVLLFRSSRGLVLCGVLFIALTLITAGLAIWDLREHRITDEMRDAKSLCIVLSEQTARTIQAVDLVIQQTQAMVQAKGIQTSINSSSDWPRRKCTITWSVD